MNDTSARQNSRTFFDSLHDMVFVLDDQGAILRINHAVTERLGYVNEELQEHAMASVYPEAQQEAVAQVIAGMLTGETPTYAIPVQAKDGRIIPVETRVARGQWDNRPVIFASSRDITERVASEQEVRRHTTQMETLRQIGMELTAQLDLDVLLESIVAHAVALLNANRGELYLYRPEPDRLEWVVGLGFNAPMMGTVLQFGEGLSGKIWEAGKPLIIDNYHEWPGRSHAYDALAISAVVGAPIRWGDAFLGVINVAAELPRTFSQDDASLLDMLATRAAIAIRNANLMKAERAQRGFAEALVEAAAAVNSTLDLDQVLDRILEQVGRVVLGDACNVMLVDADETTRMVRWREYQQHYDQAAKTVFPLHAFATLSQMARTGKPLIIADITVYADWVIEAGTGWARSYVGAPIFIGDTIAGFLNVDSAVAAKFTEADGQRLLAFARHAAVAIEHARLYRELQDYALALEERVQTRTLELQMQYARLDAILYSTMDGIVVVDPDGHFSQVNSVAHAWLEQKLAPEEAATLSRAIGLLAQQAREQGQPAARLLDLKGLDLELRSAPVPEVASSMPNAELATVVVDIHDVSHLKALERMKTRFITDISHELRTPVTAIQLYAHLLQQLPNKVDEYLPKLVQQADWQASLVEEIQEVAHLDAGRVEMRFQLADLNRFVMNINDKYIPKVARHGLMLDCCPSSDIALAQVDLGRLEHALDNLLLNAIHYTAQGGRITLAVRIAEGKGRHWATITVRDTGIGIPEEEQTFLFERFFRGTQAQLMHPGTGLGLVIVREIVLLHGGYVTVESPPAAPAEDVPAGGTAFTIWLPLVKDVQEGMIVL